MEISYILKVTDSIDKAPIGPLDLNLNSFYEPIVTKSNTYGYLQALRASFEGECLIRIDMESFLWNLVILISCTMEALQSRPRVQTCLD